MGLLVECLWVIYLSQTMINCRGKWAKFRMVVIPERKRLRPAASKCLKSVVAGPRIELGTRGFSVRCSTG
jgi:hypothetical protein